MLNKEVCKKCNEDHRLRWTDSDERRWHRRQIYCPENPVNAKALNAYTGEIMDIHNIPDFCICGLEHIVENRQDEIDKKWLISFEDFISGWLEDV